MQTLRLIISTSQHHLLEAFAGSISSAHLPPLARESVVVLSNGMARWISIELATRLGVAAGLEFSFPNDLLDRCFNAVLPESKTSCSFTRSSLTWQTASRLPSLSKEQGFEQIDAYLGKSHDDRHLLQISRSLADCYDQYTIFRPEMIRAWDNGADNQWQAILWRSIGKTASGSHRAALLEELHRHVATGLQPHSALPQRISLFGISYLPPFHLEALKLLSAYCPVTCYLLNPCGFYWGTLISEKRKSSLSLQQNGVSDACEYYETGNPLLSSLGTLGQEFFETLLEYGFEEEILDSETKTGAATTLLSSIQHDILSMADRRTNILKEFVSEHGRTVQVHSCHGPLREMEVLHDHLLAMFDELSDLEPRNIVVMTPDIESYAPYINAVFGSRSTGRPQLPYTISDRSIHKESPYIEAFLKIFDLHGSRFALSEIMDMLELPTIRNRFDLNEKEVISIRNWLTDCKVRWGLDADHRAAMGFPGYHDFSWQAGLDRLFLGYALSVEDSATFHNIAPYPACSGKQSETLGKLAEFINALRHSAESLNEPRTLPEWADAITAIVSGLLVPDEKEPAGPLTVTRALHSLREACSQHGFTGQLHIAAVKDHLVEMVTGNGGGYSFMGGSITFCAMLPMRSIPMRVIWLAGMNDGLFPRTGRPPGFNLMNGVRRRGDRSLRDEDRYLFLEALMAAQDRFCISYTGQHNRDNSSMPPSVVVAELLDYIAKGFIEKDGTPASVLTRHRLHSFSPHYFDNHDPVHFFSYDREICHAVESRRLANRTESRFLDNPLAPLQSPSLQISLHQLASFLKNPAAAFLEQRLGIRPFNLDAEPDDSEPFAPDALVNYSLLQELTGQLLQGADYATCYEAARSRGELPPLAAGKTAFDNAWASSSQLAAKVLPSLGTQLDPLVVNFTHGNVLLHATLDGCRSDAHIRWRCAVMKGKDRLAIWLDHLLLNIAKTKDYPLQSILVASDTILELPPLDHAADIISDLLDLYCEGMRRPLPFFPETSWAFLQGGENKAAAAWSGSRWGGGRGECEHRAVATCFGDSEPWCEEFTALAKRIYEPLVAAANSRAISPVPPATPPYA